MNYIKLFVRKNAYGGKGWAFDCDQEGNIIGDMMNSGFADMLNMAQEIVDKRNLKSSSDVFSIFGEIRQIKNS